MEQLHHRCRRISNSSQVVTLSITDVDDTAPVYLQQLDGATDASSVTYDLKLVDDFVSFTIDPSTGVVTLTDDPDFESQSSYSFMVVATDLAGNLTEKAVTLSITDLDKYVEAGAVDIGNGWRWTNWLGYFNIASDPWIYHLEHKWIYIPPGITNFDNVFSGTML